MRGAKGYFFNWVFDGFYLWMLNFVFNFATDPGAFGFNSAFLRVVVWMKAVALAGGGFTQWLGFKMKNKVLDMAAQALLGY